MAEAFALAASVVSFVQLADRIIGIIRICIESSLDCPRELRAILVEVTSLKAVLESLEFLLKANAALGPDPLDFLAGDDGLIEVCRRSVAELAELLPKNLPTAENTKRIGNFSTKHLLWSLRQAQVNKLLKEIAQCKTSISLALTCESVNDIKEIKKSLRRVEDTLTENERFRVYDWLATTNPSDNHNRARGLHDQHTSDWMLRSNEWKAWIAREEKFLWVHGIPGAGKTILASFLIDQIQTICYQRELEHCEQNPNSTSERHIATVYYYCFYARNQEEANPFLRWLVSQLCRRAGLVPKDLVELCHLSHTPSIPQLLNALEQILEKFETVFVVVDAVDEGPSRQRLLDVLRNLATERRFSRLQLLATSREYNDIECSFANISSRISMDNPLVKEDIRVYLQSALRSNRKFAYWPKDLLEECENALNEGAKGMFRWVICQLDILERLGNQNDVRSAVKNLPKTLYETYERIFKLIHEDDVSFVKQALVLICGSSELGGPLSMPASVLIEGISFTLYQTGPNGAYENTLLTIESLKEKCGCLISHISATDEHQFVSLAHYTVQEYLYSSSIATSQVASFALSDTIVKRELVKLVCKVAVQVLPKLKDFVRTTSSGEGKPWTKNADFSNLQRYCVLTQFIIFNVQYRPEIARDRPVYHHGWNMAISELDQTTTEEMKDFREGELAVFVEKELVEYFERLAAGQEET